MMLLMIVKHKLNMLQKYGTNILKNKMNVFKYINNIIN